MRKTIGSVLLLLAFAATVSSMAGARGDVIVRKQLDEKKNTIYMLINTSSRSIKARVELTKRCAGQSNEHKTQITEHWLQPNGKTRLGRSWSRTSCERDYRVLKAEYL